MTNTEYSVRLKAAMAARRIRGQPGHVSIKDLAKAVNVSYEQLRRVLNAGSPHLSRYYNDRICDVLKLNKDEMWDILTTLKLQKKHGIEPRKIAPKDRRAQNYWQYLTDAQQEDVINAIKAIVEKNRKEAERDTAAA